jgi:hypothetical protein
MWAAIEMLRCFLASESIGLNLSQPDSASTSSRTAIG